jgi:hypothetical protein
MLDIFNFFNFFSFLSFFFLFSFFFLSFFGYGGYYVVEGPRRQRFHLTSPPNQPMTTRQCIEIESNHNNFWEIGESETTALNFGSMVYPVLVPSMFPLLRKRHPLGLYGVPSRAHLHVLGDVANYETWRDVVGHEVLRTT